MVIVFYNIVYSCRCFTGRYFGFQEFFTKFIFSSVVWQVTYDKCFDANCNLRNLTVHALNFLKKLCSETPFILP